MTALPKHLHHLNARERLDFEIDTLKILTADLIALLMEDMGISQKELADRLGTSAANISRSLSGSQNLTLSTIAGICHALGVRMRPQLVPGHRVSTVAAADPPLPTWVTGQHDIESTFDFTRSNVPAAETQQYRERYKRELEQHIHIMELKDEANA